MTPESLLGRAALWAGLISVDITGCGPWMISQPIAAGPIMGWILGQVHVGIVIGGIVQLVWMDVTPVGVGIPFDTTAVTLLAVYWASLNPQASLAQMVLALAVAVPFGYVFCLMDSYARRLNTVGARRIENVPDKFLPISLSVGIVAGLIWGLVRYAGFYILVMFAGQKFFQWLHGLAMPDWAEQGLQIAAYLLPIAGLGVALELFLTDEPERRYRAALRTGKRRDD